MFANVVKSAKGELNVRFTSGMEEQLAISDEWRILGHKIIIAVEILASDSNIPVFNLLDDFADGKISEEEMNSELDKLKNEEKIR